MYHENKNQKSESQPQCPQPMVCVIVVDSSKVKEVTEFIPHNNKKSKIAIEEIEESDDDEKRKQVKKFKNKRPSSDCYTVTTVFNELVCD